MSASPTHQRLTKQLCQLLDDCLASINDNVPPQLTIFVNKAHRALQELTEPLIDAMDDEEDILSYEQSKERIDSLTEIILGELTKYYGNSPTIENHVTFLSTYVRMSMMHVLNQSTNDDEIIEKNWNESITQWNTLIDSLSTENETIISSLLTLSLFYRGETYRMLVERGLNVDVTSQWAERDFLNVIERAPHFSYAYESLNHVYTSAAAASVSASASSTESNGEDGVNKALSILTKGIEYGSLASSNMSVLDKTVLYLARGFCQAYEAGDLDLAFVDYKNALECDPSCVSRIPKKLHQQLGISK